MFVSQALGRWHLSFLCQKCGAQGEVGDVPIILDGDRDRFWEPLIANFVVSIVVWICR